MAAIFECGEKKEKKVMAAVADYTVRRPWYITLLFFSLMVALLLVVASGLISWLTKLTAICFMAIGISIILIIYYSSQEVKEWVNET